MEARNTTHGVTRRFVLMIGCLALGVAAFALGAQVATRGWPALTFGAGPGSRVRAALAERDLLARTAALVPVLSGLRPAELDEVMAAYEASFRGVGPGETAIELLCEVWAALDPRGALERIRRWPEEGRSEGVRACLRSWARREPLAAYEWAASSGEGRKVRRAVFSGWAESGDPAVWDFVARMTPGLERELASTFLMEWVVARGGPEALLARVEALPDDAPGRFKLAAFRTAAGLVTSLDPQLALAFVDRHADGPYAKSLLKRLAVRQVKRDGPGTMQMLLDRPAGREREWALREAYRRWLRLDRAAALSWMPETAGHDPRFLPLCEIYAVALAYSDPEHRGQSIARAVLWADGIADAATRQKTWVELGVIWLHYEPEAAAAWLGERGLEAEVRAVAALRREFYGHRPSAEEANPAAGALREALP